MRNLFNSVAFYSKLAAVSGFQNTHDFFRETNLFFRKETKFRTFRDILLIQLHSTVNLLPLAIVQKNHKFFSKNTFISFNITNFWTFWEFLHFQRPCSANLLLLAILKKNQEFFRKTNACFFKKNVIFERFEKPYYFSCILQISTFGVF